MTVKILAIYPGFNPDINEMAVAWKDFSSGSGFDFMAFAPEFDSLKNSKAKQREFIDDRFAIKWFQGGYPLTGNSVMYSIAKGFNPDIVVAGTTGHLDVAENISKMVGAKLVLHTEYFYTDRHLVSRRKYMGLGILLPHVAAHVRNKILKKIDQVWVADPREISFYNGLGTKVRSLPWPHPDPHFSTPLGMKDFSQIVYIGSLSRAKKSDVLARYYCEYLKVFPKKNILVIGPATDKTGRDALKFIQSYAGNRLTYKPHVSREEAMSILSSAPFVFVPGDSMSWGLIGDSWRRGTPVISQAEHYDLVDGFNCMKVDSAEQFADVAGAIEHELPVWERIVRGGVETGLKHSPSAVARRIVELVSELTEKTG